MNVISRSKQEAKKAATIPVTNPNPMAVTASILKTDLSVRLYRRTDNNAPNGIIKQQPRPFSPGIVIKTAAPNPQTKAGKYFFNPAPSNCRKNCFRLNLK